MNLPYYTFTAHEDGTIYSVMRTNTDKLEFNSDRLRGTFHEDESEHVLAANDDKKAYRLERDSEGAVQLVPKEAE